MILMKNVIGFLLKWQMVFLFCSIVMSGGVFCYFYFIENIGSFKMMALTGVIMAVILGFLTTMRLVIYFLLKFTEGDPLGFQPRNFVLEDLQFNSIDFIVFCIRFFGVLLITFCYALAILSMLVFILDR